jgi:putative hydrolase of the HAD superfamily
MSAHVRDYVFDLDNTLYPVNEIYEVIGERMTEYIAQALRLDRAEALIVQERYFHQYGATVSGLMKHHGLDGRAFMAHVHDVDYSTLIPDPELIDLIARLPGRRIVFTNGGGGHGQRALKQLGLDAHFERVFDMEDAGFTPKPERAAYDQLISTCEIDPRGAVLVEDTLKNLEPAHAMGFYTVLVGPVHPEPKPDYLDARYPDVKAFLRDHLAQVGVAAETR